MKMYIFEFYWLWKKREIQCNKDKHSKIKLKITVGMCAKPDKSKSCFLHWDFSCVYTWYLRRANRTTPSALIGSYIAKSLLYSVNQTMSFSVIAHPLMDLLTTAIVESKVEINFWNAQKKKNHTCHSYVVTSINHSFISCIRNFSWSLLTLSFSFLFTRPAWNFWMKNVCKFGPFSKLDFLILLKPINVLMIWQKTSLFFF